MVEERIDRRLAVIFAGDVAGYSQLMGADEEGTLRQLKRIGKNWSTLKSPNIVAELLKPPDMECWWSSLAWSTRCAARSTFSVACLSVTIVSPLKSGSSSALASMLVTSSL